MVNVTRYSPIGDIFDDLFKGFVVRPVSYDTTAAATRCADDASSPSTVNPPEDPPITTVRVGEPQPSACAAEIASAVSLTSSSPHLPFSAC